MTKIYKVLLLSIILTFSFSIALSQEASDSLDVIAMPDSLVIQAILDSLDNLENQKDIIDYEAYKDLFNKIDSYKTNSREDFQFDSPNANIYSAQDHYFASESNNFIVRKNGFTELSNTQASYMKLQHYNRFYKQTHSAGIYSLEKEYYQLPVTILEAVSGLGDYDLGTAYFAIKKNHFRNKYNLDARMNFLKANLYYGEELASNSSVNLLAPLYEDIKLEVAYNSVSYEGPFTKLLPAFRISEAIFEENSQSFSGLVKSKYFDFGIKYSSEEYRKIMPEILKQNTSQFILGKEYSSEDFRLKTSYEFFLKDENFYSQELNSLSSDINHLLYAELDYRKSTFFTENRLLLSEPYQVNSSSKLGYSFNDDIRLYLQTDFSKSRKKTNLFPDNPEWTALITDHTYLNENSYLALGSSYHDSTFYLQGNIGLADIEFENISLDSREEYSALKSELEASIKHKYNKYSINYNTKLKGYYELDGYDMMLTPALIMTNSLDIARDVGYNNYVKAGLSHHYGASYYGFEDNFLVSYQDTSLLDAYIGFQITRLFELRTSFKNILNRDIIYGYKNIPQSVIVTVSWNFIN